MTLVNGNLGKIVVGAIVTVAVGTAGTGIVANDVRNTGQHIEIRKEIVTGDKELREKVADVKEAVYDIRSEQRELSAYIKAKL